MKLIKKLCGLFRCPGCGTYYNPTYGKNCPTCGQVTTASAAGSCELSAAFGRGKQIKKGRCDYT